MSSEWKQNEIVIVGAGLAGLFTALKLSPVPVTIVTSAPLGKGSSSSWAQAGIAAAIDKDDTAFAHAYDTMQAGAGTVNPHIAHILTSEAVARIDDLLSFGTPFDRNPDGQLLMSREAAHSARRVVRVKGDEAGRAIMNTLISAVRAKPNIQIIEGYTAKKLAVKSKRITGVHIWSGKGKHLFLTAQSVVLAAGGIGALYKITTNPRQANGEALAMAAKVGAVIADPEFVQFHPTAINSKTDPAPLATEALRGEGATLINKSGKRFMQKIHADAELAPRDIVARAVFAENIAGREAFLDCRTAIGVNFKKQFPLVYKKCRKVDIDPVTQPIPVAPAAHFHMGGIFTDAFGRTSLDGLWACGEVASTGAHGANRLASNSLLEAVVFAARVAKDLTRISGYATRSEKTIVIETQFDADIKTIIKKKHQKDIEKMRIMMDRHVGIERNEKGLKKALKTLQQLLLKHEKHLTLHNMLTTARIITVMALMRKESRGGHYRTDFPKCDHKNWSRRTTISIRQIDEAEREFE